MAKSDVDILYESKEHTITIDDKTRGNQIVDADNRIKQNGFSGASTVAGRDHAIAVLYLQKHQPFGWIKCKEGCFNIVYIDDNYVGLADPDGSSSCVIPRTSLESFLSLKRTSSLPTLS